MNFHRIRLKNFRGVEQVEIRPALQGVTIIQGPNEAGKSTIAEAVDLLFEELDSSGKKSVKSAQPVGRDVGPEVEIEVETGAYRFTYFKRFLKDQKTELKITHPRPESLAGREAHDRVAKILKDTVDIPLWKALRLQQGVALSQPEIPENSHLSQALDRAAGGAAAGEAESTLFERVRAECEQYYTATGHERPVLKTATDSASVLETMVTNLEAQYRSLETDVKRCGDLAREIQRLKEQRSDDASKFAAIEARWQKVSGLKNRLSAIQKEEGASKDSEKAARLCLMVRQTMVGEVDQLRKQVVELAAATTAAEAALETDQELLRERKGALDRALAESGAAQKLQLLRTGDLEFRRNEAELRSLSEQQGQARRLQETSVKSGASVSATKVTDVVLQKLRDASLALDLAKGQQMQKLPRVQVRAFRNLALEKNGKEASLSKGDSLDEPLAETLTLKSSGDFEIVVDPGASAADLKKRVDEAHGALSTRCAEAGVGSLEEAVRVNELLKEAKRLQSESETQLKALLRGESLEARETKIAGLRAKVAPYPASRGSAPPMAPDLDSAVSASKEAEAAAKRASQGVDDARKQAESCEKGFHEREVQQSVKKNSLEENRARLGEKEQSLARARTETSDETLVDALQKAERALALKSEEYRLAVSELNAESPEAFEAQYSNAKQTLERQEKDLRDREKDHTGLESRLRTLEEQGLFEKLQSEKSRLEHARRDRDALYRRARAAKLLFDVMAAARLEAKRAYIAPYRDQLHRLGRVIFDDSFEVEVGENLQIAKRTLDGLTLPFESLSGGAKEQLSIVARLACALMVAKDGGGPLILDDVLGYADPDRLERMGALLSSASRECQVIVMTPVPDRYRHVGSANVIRMG